MEPNKIRNVALESARERQINSAGRLLFKKRVTRGWDDSDDFNRLVLLFRFIQIGASSSVGTAGILRRWRICRRVLNALSERVAVRPKFLSQNFVDHRDLRTGLGRFRFGEGATTHDRQSNG